MKKTNWWDRRKSWQKGAIIGFLVSFLPYFGTFVSKIQFLFKITQILLIPIIYILEMLGFYSGGDEAILFYTIPLLHSFYIILGGLVGIIISTIWKK